MAKKIGALWQKKDKNNRTYLTGEIETIFGKVRISILRNMRKQQQKSNAPDWHIILNEPRQKQEKIEVKEEKVKDL